MNREELKNILPHREPMLLVDDAEIIWADEAIGHYTVKGDEWFLQGHFPGNPVVPGIVLCEMIGQASCVLLADAVKGKTPYFTGLDKVKFRHTVRPGDCLEIKCKLVGSQRGRQGGRQCGYEFYSDGCAAVMPQDNRFFRSEALMGVQKCFLRY